MSPTKTKTSAGMETVDETVNRARTLTENVKRENQGTISAETLQSQPDFNLTPAKPPTQTAALGGTIEAMADQTDEFVKKLETETAQAQQGRNSSLSDYVTALRERQGLTALTAQAEEESGVHTADLELQDINNQIRQEERALKKAREAVLSAGGQSKAQAQAMINNLERESFSKQADLAVIQLAKQGRFDSAKAIADRKAKAMFEQETNEIEALQFNYTENKDLFTKSEQRLFETNLADRERELQKQIDEQKRIQELAIQALADGAPASVVAQMQQAETISEATQLGGSYIGRLDRLQKEASIRASNASAAANEAQLQSANGTIDGEPQTAVQQLVNSYANRLIESEQVFSEVAEQFADPMAFGGSLPNILQSPERQMYEQSKRNFVNAVLRRESGAVISDEEFKNAEKQYFPQAGDAPATVLQKAANRNTVINNFYREANVPRPVFPGDIIQSEGKTYQVSEDGETLVEL